MTPQERRAMRREQVERYLSSTTTMKSWCELNRVAESTMYAWIARFREEEPDMFGAPRTSEWIELSRGAIASRTALAKVDGGAPRPAGAGAGDAGDAVAGPAIVVRINGAAVAVPAGAAEPDIAAVMRAVASL